MKHFLKNPDQFVQQALKGLVAARGGELTLLDGFPEIKVVMRSQWNPGHVALVSGGGSGHEPAHAGFVGEGMLTAAVAGEVFASPGVEAVLAALLAVDGPAGTLLIVKNYTGDRLNFGLAAQLARARGCRVEVVLVADDVALPGAEQARGLAGTLFVHKIAGALAAGGASLEEVAAAARQVAAEVVSLGLSLTGCHPPGHPREPRVPAHLAELGLGIHGEPGVETLAMDRADHLLAAVLQRLPQPSLPCAVLLNNLGGVPPLEMSLLTEALMESPLAANIEFLVGPAALMTSYDMKGFSLSLLPLRPQWRTPLLAPAPNTAWPPASRPVQPSFRPLPAGLQPLNWQPSACPERAQQLRLVAQALIDSEADLNALDARIGDGDTGTTLARAGRRLLEELDALPLQEPAQWLLALAQICSRSMGGSSGVLLSLWLTRAAQAWSGSLVEALLAALQELPEDGGARPGQRTAVDALMPGLLALQQEGPRAAAREARRGALGTADMLSAGAGRSATVGSAHLEGVVDPGAEAVARVFERLCG